MQDFSLALVQQDSPVGKTQENLALTVKLAQNAARRGAQLILFPELNLTGHAGTPLMIRDAQEAPDGPLCAALIRLARDLGVYLCAGLAEREGAAVYNTMVLLGPEGYLGKQRKLHLSADEYFYFRHGSALPVFTLPFARVGVIICYDNQIPEVSRCLTVDGAEVLLCPHASRFGVWPKDAAGRKKQVARIKGQWQLVHSCRAYDNGAYVALCNTAGQSAQGIKKCVANHAGGCMIFDPHGKVLAQSSSRDIKPETLLVKLPAAPIRDRREGSCFNLRTRRAESFAALSRPTA